MAPCFMATPRNCFDRNRRHRHTLLLLGGFPPRLQLSFFSVGCCDGFGCRAGLLLRRRVWEAPRLSTYASARARINREKRVRRRMIQGFESLVHLEKPFRRVWNVQRFLAKHPAQAMPARELEKRLECARLLRCPKFVSLLRKYPAIFSVSQENGLEQPLVKFAERARDLLHEEQSIRRWYEPLLVQKIRKLLMMSTDNTLQLDHLCAIEQELALPDHFRERMAYGYPDFFKVVEGEQGPFLQLTAWDDEALEVTAREKNVRENPLFDKRNKMLPFGFPICLPRCHRLGIKDTQALDTWQRTPFVSPYETPKWVDPMSVAAGKRLPDFVDRHFGIFYLSHRGDRNHVFLKEAYRAVDDPTKAACLINRGPHVLLNELFCSLMQVRQ